MTTIVIRLFALALLTFAAPVWAQEQRPGVAIDAKGGAVDPTKNVLDLVEAAVRRLDGLLSATEKYLQSRIEAAEKSSASSYVHSQEMARAQAKRLESEAALRSEYDEKLRVAEAKRIDAIRAVDVNAVAPSLSSASGRSMPRKQA